MSRRHPLTLVAAAATVLASFPLSRLFESLTWLFYAGFAVAIIAGVSIMMRSLRSPLWLQLMAMLVALTTYLLWRFPSGGEIGGIVPSGASLAHLRALVVEAGSQIRSEAAPVPDRPGLLMLTTAGIGLVAILVNLLAVGIPRPALAGLPMLAIYSVPVAVLPDQPSFLPFGFAAAGYLWLLASDNVDRIRRFGRRFTGEGRDVDVWAPAQLSAAGRRLGLLGVVVAMLLPIVLPGLTYSVLDRFGTGPTASGRAGTGGVTTVDLFALLNGKLVQSNVTTMVRMATTDPSPQYLRFGVAEEITVDGFRSTTPVSGVLVNSGLPGYQPAPGVSAHQYQATVEVGDLDLRLAPAYRQLVAVRGLDNSWFYDAPTETVFSRRGSVRGRTYSFDFVHRSYTAAVLRTAGPVPIELTAFTRVPEIPYIAALVAQLTDGRSGEYDQVRALFDHFSTDNGFTYSLQTVAGNSGSPIVDFLNSKRGFCTQYAAAMAWLARAAGYPARVAFGFTLGFGAVNGIYSLTNRNLHAWAEIYFPNFGWVPFDTTPASSIEGAVVSPWTSDLPEPSATPEPAASGSGGPGSTATPLPRGFDPGTGEIFPGLGPAGVSPWLLAGAALATVALGLLVAPSVARRALRRRRRRSRDPANSAHAAWQELLDTMTDYEVPVLAWETPRLTANRLSRLPALRPGAPQRLRLLAAAEERARYARTPIPPTGLAEAVSLLRAALAERALLRTRIGAVLFPRSVTRRWWGAAQGLVSRASAAAARGRELYASVSPRRLLRPRGVANRRSRAGGSRAAAASAPRAG